MCNKLFCIVLTIRLLCNKVIKYATNWILKSTCTLNAIIQLQIGMQLTSKRKGKEWYALPFLFLRVSYCRKIVIYKYNMVYNTIVRIFFIRTILLFSGYTTAINRKYNTIYKG